MWGLVGHGVEKAADYVLIPGDFYQLTRQLKQKAY